MKNNKWFFDIFLLFISMCYGCSIIFLSFKQGRLATVISYDDIVYFQDGLSKLRYLNDNGMLSFIDYIVKIDIHSPLSTFIAMLSFAVFGAHDWAPYVINILFIAIVLLVIRRLLISVGEKNVTLFVILLFSVPFVGYTIHEFRPDLPTGLFTAIGLVYLLLKPIEQADIKYTFYVSLWFAAALLSKPSASLFTLGIYILSVGLLILTGFFYRKKQKKILTNGILYITTTIFIISPYYILNIKHIYNYIAASFGANKDIWGFTSLSIIEKIKLYLTGSYGQSMFGNHLYILLFLNLSGLIWHFLVCDSKKNIHLVIFLIVTVVAWIIPSWSAFQNPFFAATMYFLLLLMPAFIISSIAAVKKIEKKERVVIMLFFLLSSVTGFYFFKPVEFYYGIDKNLKEASWEVANTIHTELLKDYNDTSQIFIYLNGTGAVNMELLNYMRLRNHKKNNLVALFSFRPNLEEWKSFLDKADYALVVEQGIGGLVNENFPSGKILNETLALVQQDVRFELVRSIKIFTGKHFFLFKKSLKNRVVVKQQVMS